MKQGLLTRFFKFFSTQRRESGQALVEYILVLFVIVSLLFAAKGLFTSVDTFIQEYIGEYFTCLMDHGELPQLGIGSSSGLAKHTSGAGYKCTAEFSVANGAQVTGGGTGGNNNSGANGSGNSSGASSNSNGGRRNNANDSSGRNSANDSSSVDTAKDIASKNNKNGSRSSSRSAYNDGRISRSNSGYGVADGGTNTGSKTKIIGDPDDEGSIETRSGRFINKTSGYRLRDPYRAVTGKLLQQIESKQLRSTPRAPASKKVAEADVEEGFRPGPRRSEYKPPVAKTTAEEEEVELEMGFGYMLKWIIIAGMIVAILIFFGGQVLNYSNSDSN